MEQMTDHENLRQAKDASQVENNVSHKSKKLTAATFELRSQANIIVNKGETSIVQEEHTNEGIMTPREQVEHSGLSDKKSQLRQLRLQQQRILTKKARQLTMPPSQMSPANNPSRFTKAQYMEMAQENDDVSNRNPLDLAKGPSTKAKKVDINSFELPKKSHKILPQPDRIESKQSQNAATMLVRTNKNIAGSSSLLPTLKTSLEDGESAPNSSRLLNYHGSDSAHQNPQQLYERSGRNQHESQNGTPQVSSNLERNKQYLEQLRQLAQIRHKKQNSGLMSKQNSVKTKKNGGNKAEAALLSAQIESQQQSPSGKQSGLLPISARASIPQQQQPPVSQFVPLGPIRKQSSIQGF